MKTKKVIAIAILCGILLLLCCILGLGLRSNGRNFFNFSIGDFSAQRTYTTTENYQLVLEKEIDPQGISDIQVQYDMNSNSVFFYESTENTILIKEYMNFTPDEDLISTVQQKGDDLIITGKKRNSSFSFIGFIDSPRAYTEIYLPADFGGSLTVKTVSGDICSDMDFALEGAFLTSSTSGDISFPKITAHSIQAASTSGNILLQHGAATEINIATTSGNITLNYATGEKLISTTSGEVTLTYTEGATSVSSTSGDIRILGGTDDYSIGTVSGEIRVLDMTGCFELNATSGDISLDNAKGCGNASTVSGEIRIFLDELTGNLNIDTTSGDVSLKLPEDSAFAFDYSSTSGDCNTFFDDVLSFNKKGTEAKGQYGVADGKLLNVSTVSGDLRITK